MRNENKTRGEKTIDVRRRSGEVEGREVKRGV